MMEGTILAGARAAGRSPRRSSRERCAQRASENREVAEMLRRSVRSLSQSERGLSRFFRRGQGAPDGQGGEPREARELLLAPLVARGSRLDWGSTSSPTDDEELEEPAVRAAAPDSSGRTLACAESLTGGPRRRRGIALPTWCIGLLPGIRRRLYGRCQTRRARRVAQKTIDGSGPRERSLRSRDGVGRPPTCSAPISALSLTGAAGPQGARRGGSGNGVGGPGHRGGPACSRVHGARRACACAPLGGAGRSRPRSPISRGCGAARDRSCDLRQREGGSRRRF